MKGFGLISFVVTWFLLAVGCSNSLRAESISVVNWNIQTFFDCTKDGCEYSDFLKNASWNKDSYSSRLNKLTGAMKLMDADIFVFEEVENEGVIYDISNYLSGNTWNHKKNWNYACFAKNEGDSIGCAVLSRFELESMTVHNLEIGSEKEQQPSMRPIMKILVKTETGNLVLLVNHWKSKSGGAENSDKWRNWQESVLNRLVGECAEQGVLCCGDFNRDISEFDCIQEGTFNQFGNFCNLRLRSFSPCEIESQAVYSPWMISTGSFVCPGSYYYDEEFERIDHFFSSGKLKIDSFFPVTSGKWCDEEGIPLPFKIYNGSGYSDHLPIKCILSFEG